MQMSHPHIRKAIQQIKQSSERVICNQLGKHMDTFLNKLLCIFRKSTLLNMHSLSYYNDGTRNLITLD